MAHRDLKHWVFMTLLLAKCINIFHSNALNFHKSMAKLPKVPKHIHIYIQKLYFPCLFLYLCNYTFKANSVHISTEISYWKHLILCYGSLHVVINWKHLHFKSSLKCGRHLIKLGLKFNFLPMKIFVFSHLILNISLILYMNTYFKIGTIKNCKK